MPHSGYITGESTAPIRDVKRLQFGILSPDELVCFLIAKSLSHYIYNSIVAPKTLQTFVLFSFTRPLHTSVFKKKFELHIDINGVATASESVEVSHPHPRPAKVETCTGKQ